MQIHELKRRTENRKTAIVGRGGKRGKTSGRGGKGQTARAGHKIRPEMRDTIKKMPKLRGYAFKAYSPKPFVVNVSDLEVLFSNGDSVNPQKLVEKGVFKLFAGKNPRVKILATGELTKKLNISDCIFSIEAKNKIEKAGGVITEISKVKKTDISNVSAVDKKDSEVGIKGEKKAKKK
jgi:large subunit ribosomal protein L15